MKNNDKHRTFPFRWLAAAVLASCLWAGRSAAQVVVEMKLDTAEILVGQQVQLAATVTADAQQQVDFPSYKEGGQLVKGLEVIRQSRTDTSFLNDRKRMQLTRKYTITSFDSAIYTIPEMEVTVDGKAYKAKAPVGLKVSVVPVDTTQLDQFSGPHAVVPEAFSWRNRWLMLALGTWLVAVLFFVVAIRLTRRKPLTTRKVIQPQIPPYQQASAVVKGLKVPADRAAVKDFYVALTDALRVYLQQRFGVLAMEKTTEEILAAMDGKVDAAALADLKFVFETADLVKFAKFAASEFEMNRSLSVAEKFLSGTIDEKLENPEPIVKIVVLNDGMQRKYRVMLWTALAVLGLGGSIYLYVVCEGVFHTFF